MKSYTDISQSKKLAEILPLESADMYYDYDVQKHEYYPMIMDDQFDDTCVRAWSLAALLSVLPLPDLVQDKADNELFWQCSIYDEDGILLCETYDNNPVDACVAMIEKLHGLKLL